MNWYKKAQFNYNRVKYNEYRDHVYLLSKNTKPGEGPWRVSWMTLKENEPQGHVDFNTYEQASEAFDKIDAIEAPPDLDFREVVNLRDEYELV